MILLLLMAWAQSPEANRVAVAEVERLGHQMEQYAKRQAWTAVERSYQNALGAGPSLTAEMHQLGAHAARDRGDITAVEQRLQAALAIGSEGQVIEELWAITQTYGRVSLVGVELIATKTPFDPVQVRCLRLAQEKLRNEGAYQGLLPRGVYVIDGVTFHLLLGRPAVDLTTPLGKRNLQRREKGQKKEKKKKN